jgi:fibronectin type 3 domain-containing protein
MKGGYKMSFGKWLVVFSLTLLIFLVATSVVASPIEKEKPLRTNQFSLYMAPAPGTLAVNLVWSRAAGDVRDYRIERSSDGGATWPTSFTVLAPSTSYQDASVARGGTYWYRIVARSSQAEPITSNMVRIYISDTAPAAPVYPAAVIAGPNSISLSWNNTSTAVDGYVIERATGQDADLDFKVVARIDSPLATTWTDKRISASETYIYQVRSFNQFGASYPSERVTVGSQKNH